MADSTTVPSTSSSFVPPRPGDIELAFVKIVNFDQSEVQNITLLVREFSIYESIYSNAIRADLVIEDALSLITRMPIIGEEVVLIRFRTPSITPETFTYSWIDVAMRLVRIDNVAPTNIRDGVYRMELVSIYQLLDSAAFVSQAYGPGPVSGMVKKLATDWLAIDSSKLEVEETDGDHRFIVPGLRPFAAMNFFANEAKSKTYIPSDFVFFETHAGHKFVTISSLIAAAVKEQYFVFEQSRPSSQNPGTTTIPTVPSPIQLPTANNNFTGTNQKNPTEFRAAASITINRLFDLESQLSGGMFDNSVLWIDPLLQQYDVMPANGNTHFRYLNAWNDFQHLEKGRPGQASTGTGAAYPAIPRTGQTAKFQAGPHVRLVPTNKNRSTDYGDHPRKRQDFLPWLVSARQQNRSVVCTLAVPGDSDRMPGDVIYFELHEMGGTDDVIGALNKYISGAYLVTTIRHKYTHSAALPFVTVIECIKNCYEATIANDRVVGNNGSTTASQDAEAIARAKALMTKMPTAFSQKVEK